MRGRELTCLVLSYSVLTNFRKSIYSQQTGWTIVSVFLSVTISWRTRRHFHSLFLYYLGNLVFILYFYKGYVRNFFFYLFWGRKMFFFFTTKHIQSQATHTLAYKLHRMTDGRTDGQTFGNWRNYLHEIAMCGSLLTWYRVDQ